MLRKASLAAILVGAVGVPYAMWNSDDALQWTNGWLSDDTEAKFDAEGQPTITRPASHTQLPAFTQPQLAQDYYDPTAYGPGAGGDQLVSGAATTTGPTTITIADVLNMNVTHDWVTQRFTRVTTTLADAGHDGLRVPLVTGTSETALTGSLTYYFDRSKTLQRITFHGTTGNPMELTALLTQVLEFDQKKCLGGELYTRGWSGGTNSICRIRPASVLHAGAQSTRYEVLLEMNRPKWKGNLSDTAKQLLN